MKSFVPSEKAQLRTDLPTFGIGDTVRVFVKVVEGSREGVFQAFEGTVMAKRNGGIRRDVHRAPRVLRHRRGAHVRCIPPAWTISK